MAEPKLDKNYCRVTEFLSLDTIIDGIGTKDKLFLTFVEAFYANAYKNCNVNNRKTLQALVKYAYKFFFQRKPNEQKLRIFNPCKETHGWEGLFTVIEVVTDDAPFLVDSIGHELKAWNYTIHMRVNTILYVTRDKKGNTLDLGASCAKSEAQQECFIRFAIPHIEDKKILQELEDRISYIMKAVYCTVKDWPKMITQLNNSIDNLCVSGTNLQNSEEACKFLKWLKSDNFVFLGHTEYSIKKNANKKIYKNNHESSLGLYLLPEYIPFESVQIHDDDVLYITRSRYQSVVHRRVYMDCIKIRQFDHDKNIVGEKHILGTFASIVDFQDVRTIPIISHKINFIEQHSKFIRGGHNNKALLLIIQNFPRSELFQIPSDKLFTICHDVFSLLISPRVRIIVHQNKGENFISCLIFIPQKQFSTALADKIKTLIETKYKGTVVNNHIMIGESDLVHFYLIVKTKYCNDSIDFVSTIENKIVAFAQLWEDQLYSHLYYKLGDSKGNEVFNRYKESFPRSYQDAFDVEHVLHDIRKIDEALHAKRGMAELYQIDNSSNSYQLKLYLYDKSLTLSDILPVLGYMSLTVCDHYSHMIHVDDHVIWLHHFVVKSNTDSAYSLPDIKNEFDDLIVQVLLHEQENDWFNSLVLSSLKLREIILMRTLGRFIRQIRSFSYGNRYIQLSFVTHPEAAKILVQLFHNRFDPSIIKDRTIKQNALLKQLNSVLKSVSNIAYDEIIRRFSDVILSATRTNFYIDQQSKEYLSIKFNSKNIPQIPLPKPFAEIFVYSSKMEAIHLRGGKVARGGIRWSDRLEDFRTEVLSLMKAQTTKNVIIVPLGAKGGFITKNASKDPNEKLQQGIYAYKQFLNGMLDITDNIVNGKIVHPTDVVLYDNDDPYLVVAADKGTATFSDYANEISEQHNFWLGDAFASGGSSGYDHKELGITAKGAWVSVRQHFNELNHNIDTTPFSVVGIGDMSGDVFGNGMLLSDKILLKAAFNHMHIFLDPDPDPKISFKERQRLFKLPRSTWEDYDKKLLSNGAVIFTRSVKSLTLTPQILKMLNIQKKVLTPNELISAILCAPLDMLWNGGIGTYVKSSLETHADAADKINDNVRVNGQDLRVKIVAEGGNLGFTQLGRREFAQCGGHINTDFVDNSGGVACSDTEVNIKIAFRMAMENKRITLAQRNKLLHEMCDEVEQIVLQINHLQNIALSLSCMTAKDRLDQHCKLMQLLERDGILNREVEFLPDDKEIQKMRAEGKALTRPHLSLLLAYAKMSMAKKLRDSNIHEDKYLKQYISYFFPTAMHAKFRKEIESHPLEREIIASYVTNSIINRMGCSYVTHIRANMGFSTAEIAKIYITIRDIFNFRAIWHCLEKRDNNMKFEIYCDILHHTQTLVSKATFWFIRHHKSITCITSVVNKFKPNFEKLSQNMHKILDKDDMEKQHKRIVDLTNHNLPSALAKHGACLDHLYDILYIIDTSQKIKRDIFIVGKVHFMLSKLFQLQLIFDLGHALIHSSQYTQKLAIWSLLDLIHDNFTKIILNILKSSASSDSAEEICDTWITKNQICINRYFNFINEEVKNKDTIDMCALAILLDKISDIIDTSI